MTNNNAEESRHEGGEDTLKDYGSASAYADEVRKWLMASQCWAICHQMATMHSYNYILSCMNPQWNSAYFGAIQTSSSTLGTGSGASAAAAAAPATTTQEAAAGGGGRGGRFTQRRSIPPFSRRIAAEIIDSVIAFGLKLFIVYFLVEINAVDLDKYDRLLSDEADLQSLIDITQELFPIEMLGKAIISIVEALYISYGLGSVPAGATPGKVLMGIQVISCHRVTPLPGTEDVEIVREPTISFKNSLLRSLIKNMLINLLFPLSAAAYAFNYNRALYDLAANTIVVYI